jgi:hypothetical protein
LWPLSAGEAFVTVINMILLSHGKVSDK